MSEYEYNRNCADCCELAALISEKNAEIYRLHDRANELCEAFNKEANEANKAIGDNQRMRCVLEMVVDHTRHDHGLIPLVIVMAARNALAATAQDDNERNEYGNCKTS